MKEKQHLLIILSSTPLLMYTFLKTIQTIMSLFLLKLIFSITLLNTLIYRIPLLLGYYSDQTIVNADKKIYIYINFFHRMLNYGKTIDL